MKHKTLSLLLGAILGGITLATQAATIAASPSVTNVPAGTPQVTVSLDALTGFPSTIGGGMSISWGGGLLALDHWVLGSLWDPTALDLFAGYSLDINNGATDLYFSPNALSAGPGPMHLMDLVFNVTGTGSAVVNPTVTGAAQEWGDTSFNTINVTTASASVNVSPVPLPAAIWLMLSGLPGVFMMARRRLAAA